MIILDEYFKKNNIKEEELTPEERQHIYNLADSVNQGQLTVDKIKTTISEMKFIVEKELVDEPEYIYIFIFKVLNRKHIFLKARLKNYIFIEAMLDRSERAKKTLEEAFKNFKIPRK